ncbi:cytidine/deoxycytidylate deaminase family protein [Faecalibacter bovis]|nr:hypothetical protein [Faecalibacter bovis]
MSLDNIYQLRNDFIILGLTGKMQGGTDLVIDLLKRERFENYDQYKDFINKYQEISSSEAEKFYKTINYLNYEGNWKKFEVIEYKNVILLLLLKKYYDPDVNKFATNIVDFILNIGDYKSFINPRFGSDHKGYEKSSDFISDEFNDFLISNLSNITSIHLTNIEEDFFKPTLTDFFDDFYKKMDSYSPNLRYRFIHILGYIFRKYGKNFDLDALIEIEKKNENNNSSQHIYTVAEQINKIIKEFRKKNNQKAHLIIDRLKSSIEMNYFKEKYSGFYMCSIDTDNTIRTKNIQDKLFAKTFITDKDLNLEGILALDQSEYKINDFKKGEFASPDIENCVQKSDYHIYLSYDYKNTTIAHYNCNLDKVINDVKANKISKLNIEYVYPILEFQVFKLIALIQQPGLITPSYVERIMQIAYNTKINSGCISRQVGAVVTDANFSVKGIGWNEVPEGQTPCSSRDVRYLMNNEKSLMFSDFEKGDGTYEDNKTFKEKIKENFSALSDDQLKGRSCPYCFKSQHNAFEGKENQVHTRSLHAEENAMLQITKFGGQPLKGGYLFTTASPCELCSKKAYQLGISNIFFIDYYPGISQKHILKSGKNNPRLFNYIGGIGKGYLKFYEPFLSTKDELFLRTTIKPQEKKVESKELLELLNSKEIKTSYLDKDGNIDFDKIITLIKK